MIDAEPPQEPPLDAVPEEWHDDWDDENAGDAWHDMADDYDDPEPDWDELDWED